MTKMNITFHMGNEVLSTVLKIFYSVKKSRRRFHLIRTDWSENLRE